MALLIDGYNLIWGANIVGPSRRVRSTARPIGRRKRNLQVELSGMVPESLVRKGPSPQNPGSGSADSGSADSGSAGSESAGSRTRDAAARGISASRAQTELARSREGLLRFLVSHLREDQRSHTTVVFDAAGAPWGAPQQAVYQGIRIHFASDFAEADDLLEILIRQSTAPRQMTVVSSDHRIQRAARRRRARAIDSDKWIREILRGHQLVGEVLPLDKPEVPLSPRETASWLSELAGDCDWDALMAEATVAPIPQARSYLKASSSRSTRSSAKGQPLPARSASSERSGRSGLKGPPRPGVSGGRTGLRRTTSSVSRRSGEAEEPIGLPDQANIGNPFPAGYAEDLLEEDL